MSWRLYPDEASSTTAALEPRQQNDTGPVDGPRIARNDNWP